MLPAAQKKTKKKNLKANYGPQLEKKKKNQSIVLSLQISVDAPMVTNFSLRKNDKTDIC